MVPPSKIAFRLQIFAIVGGTISPLALILLLLLLLLLFIVGAGIFVSLRGSHFRAPSFSKARAQGAHPSRNN
jgi:hypothetical protein